MRRAILWVSFLGFGICGSAWLISLLNPLLVERTARGAIKLEVERRVGEKLDALSNSRIIELAQSKVSATDARIAQANKALRDDILGKVADVIAQMNNADCECRQRLRDSYRNSTNSYIASLNSSKQSLVELIESSYAAVSSSLLREFRIFFGSNAGAFALLGLVAVVRRRASTHLILPAIVIVGAVLVTGGFYLFGQNWLHTIVFGQYVGLAYLLYLSGVSLILADICLNRARATTRAMNVILSLVGGVASLTPC